MKCPNCNKKVSELDEKCPSCGVVFDEYDEKEETKEKDFEYGLKTKFIRFINGLQLISCIIMAFINWSNEEGLIGFVYLFSGIVVFAFIRGFADIIDLLDNINYKIK